MKESPAQLPIHKGMLAIIIKRVQRTYYEINQPYLSLLLTTMLSTAYFGVFRISEIAQTQSKHRALVTDIQIAANKNKISLYPKIIKNTWSWVKTTISKDFKQQGNWKKERIIETAISLSIQSIETICQSETTVFKGKRTLLCAGRPITGASILIKKMLENGFNHWEIQW